MATLKIQFIYFPIYLLLAACAHEIRFALPESTTAQASNAARVRSQKAPDFQLYKQEEEENFQFF